MKKLFWIFVLGLLCFWAGACDYYEEPTSSSAAAKADDLIFEAAENLPNCQILQSPEGGHVWSLYYVEDQSSVVVTCDGQPVCKDTFQGATQSLEKIGVHASIDETRPTFIYTYDYNANPSVADDPMPVIRPLQLVDLNSPKPINPTTR